jgi:pimeloyl-ACP methyl ester carboxylesterase
MGRITAAARAAFAAFGSAFAAEEARAHPPLALARNGSFYVGGRMAEIDGGATMVGHMYVEYMIPAERRFPFPIIMVHGGLRSGTNFTGTPDGREGWAQYFVRQGYAVYIVDQVGRGRSALIEQAYGPARMADARGALSRYVQQGKFNLWPQAKLHTQWPGGTELEDPVVMALSASQLPEIRSFRKQQELNRDALVALVDRIGPSILLAHSQAGAFLWPVADARPDGIKAILAIEPNGPPAHSVEFTGVPDWFKDGPVSLSYGVTDVPITYSPPVRDADELSFVREEKADAPDLVRCWAQAEPARKLPNLRMPILVITGEASYHAPYDHCTVKYLRQAGVDPTFIKLVDEGVRGNSHVLMLEKNSDECAAVIAGWLARTIPPVEPKALR